MLYVPILHQLATSSRISTFSSIHDPHIFFFLRETGACALYCALILLNLLKKHACLLIQEVSRNKTA